MGGGGGGGGGGFKITSKDEQSTRAVAKMVNLNLDMT